MTDPNADIVVSAGRLDIEVPYQSILLPEAEELLLRMRLAVEELRSPDEQRDVLALVRETRDAVDSVVHDWTPVPWKVHDTGGHYGVASADASYPNVVFAQTNWEGYGNGSIRAVAEFIASAPERERRLADAVEATESERVSLVAEVERLRAENEQLRARPVLVEIDECPGCAGKPRDQWCGECAWNG